MKGKERKKVLEKETELENAKSFDDIYTIIKSCKIYKIGRLAIYDTAIRIAYLVLKRHLSVLYLPYSSYKINYSLHLLMCALFPKRLIFFIDDSKLVYYFVKGIYNWNYSIFSPP